MNDTNEPTSDGVLAIEMRATMAELRQVVETGFTKTDATLARQEQTLALVVGDQKSMHARVSSIETRLSKVEDHPSASDIKMSSALDEEIGAREKLSAKVDQLIRIAERFEAGWDKVMANPKMKIILAAAAYAAYRYLDSHGPEAVKGLLP